MSTPVGLAGSAVSRLNTGQYQATFAGDNLSRRHQSG